MSSPLLIIVSLIYAYTALEQVWKGNIPGGVVWLSYACANAGLICSNR